tara:strand:+ start:166 stop:1404 length:1239 start_codon:yes stop_codon:yes gene_type:complete
MSSLKEVFDEQFKDVSFDRQLCQRIIKFSNNFMTRNDDHANFFGGVTMGVHPIRFLESDRERWYDEVLDIDETLLATAFKKVTSVNHSFNVMGDVFNYTPIYAAHYISYRIQSASSIPQSLKKEACVHAFMVLHYRYLTSLLIPRFRYPADPEIAQATYMRLSGRFDIRRYGSWRKLLLARSEDLVSVNSIYRNAIRDFAPDGMVIRIVTDTQGRIRELVKKIYQEYINTKESGQRVRSVSSTVMTTDGEMILRDRHSDYASYVRYIREVVGNERSFIRDELVGVISSAMKTMPPELLVDALKYMSTHHNDPRKKYLDELLQETLVYVFNYLQENRILLSRGGDVANILAKLRNLLMASRSTDTTVMKLRKDADRLVAASVRSRNASIAASVRTGVLLYIALRTLTKNYYSQ